MYDDDDLQEKRLKFLKDCKPEELRRLRKEGKPDQHLERRATQCRRRAAEIEQDGVHTARAWSVAIREVLLETEAD